MVIRTIKLTSLFVNTENYRFEPLSSQKEAIDKMIEDQGDKLYSLVDDIVTNGLSLLTGYIICATTVPDYFTERNWRMSELTSLIYGANVLLFGGLGLVVAFIVELKISQKNRKDHTR